MQVNHILKATEKKDLHPNWTLDMFFQVLQ